MKFLAEFRLESVIPLLFFSSILELSMLSSSNAESLRVLSYFIDVLIL